MSNDSIQRTEIYAKRYMSREATKRSGFGLIGSFLGIISVGLIITLMVSGGGFILPFLSIPWYVWGFGLLAFMIWLIR